MPRRPCGPPRNDNRFLSFRGQCAHWPWKSVLFTMDGGSGRRGRRPLRKVYRSPSNGPMWASAPTKRRESFINHPGQRRTAERLRQRVRGNGWESEQGSSPKGSSTSDNPSVTAAPCQLPLHKGAFGDGGCGLPRRPVGPPRNDNGFLSFRGAERRGNPSFLRWTGVRAAEVVGPYGTKRKPAATAGAAHSDAESAERGAGQIRFLPDTLRVQHGVQGSEVCGKPRPCSR